MKASRISDPDKDLPLINDALHELKTTSDTVRTLSRDIAVIQNKGASGLHLNNNPTKGTCGPALRGKFNFVAQPTGVKDNVEVCAKDAAGAYAWRTIY